MFKKCRVQSKIYIGITFEKGIQELDLRESYKYLGIEERHDMHHENEKENLKKEYWRGLRLVFGTELCAKNKIQAIGSLVVPALGTVLELLTTTKKNCKTIQED